MSRIDIKADKLFQKEIVMKALVLSLVIAFSSSFALADSCPLADSNAYSSEGALTPKNRKSILEHTSTSNHVRVVDANGNVVK